MAVNDNFWAVREAALKNIAEYHNSDFKDLFYTATSDANSKVRVAAVSALGDTRDQGMIGSFRKIFETDRGRTFTKYKNNPVLPTTRRFGDRNERDPKVFWYAPNNNWVMALFETAGISIFTSKNLKEWNYESYVEGFWECPELFELAVDGDTNNKKWVMYGASGRYKIGSFDGRKFTHETTRPSYMGGGMYAAQTYNNTPDGRRIQIGWGTIPSKGMPFNQMMTFPTEMKLKTGKEGVRLYITPIEEISMLYKKSYNYNNLAIGQKDINELVQAPQIRLLHIKAQFIPIGTDPFSIIINGHKLTYNPESDNQNETYFPQLNTDLKLEFIVDINSLALIYGCIRFNWYNYRFLKFWTTG
ncbi:hypothetical protein ES705_32627 [subsurface metagenome]